MDEGAIVVCNLAKGRLGESVAHLLGALLTTAIAQAALVARRCSGRRAPRLSSLRRRIPIVRHRKLRADPVGSAQVRADPDHRPSVSRPASRSTACRRVRQCRLDRRAAHRRRRCADPRRADRHSERRMRCSTCRNCRGLGAAARTAACPTSPLRLSSVRRAARPRRASAHRLVETSAAALRPAACSGGKPHQEISPGRKALNYRVPVY